MQGKKRLKRRRERLWKQDPHCTKCGVETILPSELIKQGADGGTLMLEISAETRERVATIDHEFNKFDPERRVRMNRERTNLLCWKCNNNRGIDDYMALPIEERQRRSQLHGLR